MEVTTTQALTNSTFVRCADDLRAFHDGYWKKGYWKAAGIMLPAMLASSVFKTPWLAFIGFAATVGFVFLPFITSYQRKVKALACPHCGKPAGRVTGHGVFPHRLFLSCVYCGTETATDCVTWGSGGKPEKLDPPC